MSLAAALIAALARSALAGEADDQYAVAAGHYARQQWEFAAEEFEAFLQDHPNHPEHNQGIFFLGETLVQLGRYDEAGRRFREFLDRDSNSKLARSALFRAGETAYLAGKPKAAHDDLETFLGRYPGDPLNAYVLAYLGDLALSDSSAAEAEAYYRRSLAEFPQSPLQDDCRFGLARALKKQGRSEEAERLYHAVAAKAASPLADDAQFHLAALEYAAGKFEEAIETFGAFESRFTESPWRPTARLARGWALWKLGRMDEASDLFQRITTDPKVGTEARYWLGLAEKSREDWDAAAATFLGAVEASPKHELAAALRFQAGDAMLRAGNPAGASEQFEQVMASAPPGNAWVDDALRGAVQAALLTKDYQTLDRRAAEFSRRFSDSPWHADVLRMLARSLIERRQYARAETVVAPLVSGENTPPTAEDHYLHSLVCRGLGRREDALTELSVVVSSAEGPLYADAQLATASLLVDLKRYREAIAPLDAFLATHPAGDAAAEAQAQRAICLARTGRLEEAKKAQQRLLAEYPGHDVTGPAVAQLAETAFEAGDEPWASELFTWLSEKAGAPELRARGLSGLAWSQYKSGKLEPAAATFERLLHEDVDPALAAEAALARGRVLQELGRADAALAMYDRVIEQYPASEQFAEALWAAARLRDDLDLDQEAASGYEEIAAKLPAFPQIDAVLYNWAWALHDLGRMDESYAIFERLQENHPDSDYWADATYRLAQRAFKSADDTTARQLVELALARKPDAAIRENFLYLWGQILAADEKWKEARKAFETLVADCPESPLRRMAEYAVAEAVFRQGDYAAAGERLRRLLGATQGRNESWLAIVHLRLAQSLAHEKRWTEAYAVASRIQKQYPAFAEQYEVDYVLGRCLASRADFEGARAAYRKVIRSPAGAKTETAAKAQLMIAESHFHQKDYELALREYLRLEILYDYPELQAAAVLQAAKCHELLGQRPQAAALYGRLLKSYPATSAAEEAARRLQAAGSPRDKPPALGAPPAA